MNGEAAEWLVAAGARMGRVNGVAMAESFGDVEAERSALEGTVGLMDLSARGRLCLTGRDRQEYLNGQVTNDVKVLQVGEGCYAALVSARGRIQSDLNIHVLCQEILLDFEPGYSGVVVKRLEQFIIADDVQVVDAAPYYGLLSVQGPRAAATIARWGWGVDVPTVAADVRCWRRDGWGDLYLVCQARLGTAGYDVFLPCETMPEVARQLAAAVGAEGGRWCGLTAYEILRVAAGIPRYGVDMDESNLVPETGIEHRAISYSKGCYIGQEVISRIRAYGQVTKALRRLRLPDRLPALPSRGDKLFKDGREVGYVTSAVRVAPLQANLAMGYIRREASAVGAELRLALPDGAQVTVY